jgi:hypothetical protein
VIESTGIMEAGFAEHGVMVAGNGRMSGLTPVIVIQRLFRYRPPLAPL